MRGKLGAAAAGLYLACFANTAFGHRLDEYLQATLFTIGKEEVRAQIRLTPGVAVFSDVMAGIDEDRDGLITAAEGRAYAERVLGDLSLSIDGEGRELQLLSATFPETEQMKEGLGEIKIDFAADARGSGGSVHQLTFENQHQASISAYLVNCLEPEDSDLKVVGQHRNYEQSVYELDYSQQRAPASPTFQAALGAAALALLARFVVLWRRRPQAVGEAKGTQGAGAI